MALGKLPNFTPAAKKADSVSASPPPARDIAGQLVFLGTGTSHGVPVIGCRCAVCASGDPKNRRTRCSVALGLPGGVLVIDTPPDLREQFLRERIDSAQAILYTHAHADHLFGLDDVRIFCERMHGELPIFCDERVERRIRESFAYAFDPAIHNGPGGGVPRLAFERIEGRPFPVLGATVTPVPLWHGPSRVLGYRIGRVAYCTDANRIPEESVGLLADLDVLILDCLRYRPHGTHFNVEQALEVVARLRPRRTLFTHICHEMDHGTVSAGLPPGVELAYDGLVVPLK